MHNKSIKAHQTPSVTNFWSISNIPSHSPTRIRAFRCRIRSKLQKKNKITEQLNATELTLLMCLILVLRTGSSIKDE